MDQAPNQQALRASKGPRQHFNTQTSQVFQQQQHQQHQQQLYNRQLPSSLRQIFVLCDSAIFFKEYDLLASIRSPISRCNFFVTAAARFAKSTIAQLLLNRQPRHTHTNRRTHITAGALKMPSSIKFGQIIEFLPSSSSSFLCALPTAHPFFFFPPASLIAAPTRY